MLDAECLRGTGVVGSIRIDRRLAESYRSGRPSVVNRFVIVARNLSGRFSHVYNRVLHRFQRDHEYSEEP
jgi:hypothetical protein